MLIFSVLDKKSDYLLKMQSGLGFMLSTAEGVLYFLKILVHLRE